MNKYAISSEYQLASRILQDWQSQPYNDDGFGESVVLARAYMAMVEIALGQQNAAPDAGGPSGREVPSAAPVAAPKDLSCLYPGELAFRRELERRQDWMDTPCQKRESVNEVLEVIETYGPWGTDIREELRWLIVMADEVKRLRRELLLVGCYDDRCRQNMIPVVNTCKECGVDVLVGMEPR